MVVNVMIDLSCICPVDIRTLIQCHQCCIDDLPVAKTQTYCKMECQKTWHRASKFHFLPLGIFIHLHYTMKSICANWNSS